jgi:hypothetical protein
MKCWYSAFHAQGSRLIIIVVQFRSSENICNSSGGAQEKGQTMVLRPWYPDHGTQRVPIVVPIGYHSKNIFFSKKLLPQLLHQVKPSGRGRGYSQNNQPLAFGPIILGMPLARGWGTIPICGLPGQLYYCLGNFRADFYNFYYIILF